MSAPAPEAASGSGPVGGGPAGAEPAGSGPAAGAASEHARLEEVLGRLDRTLQPVLTRGSHPPRVDAALERIGLHREKALEAHREGDTDSALRLLAEAEREAGALVRDEEARYRLNLQAAGDAYAAGNPADARMHVDEALEQRPDDPEAKALEARIARLPELLAERRKAEDARSARRLREERAALRRILELDPGDAGARERARTVDRELRERTFARTVAEGRRAVEDRALEQAKQALAEARRQAPQHADTRRLRTLVAELERVLSRDRHLAAAERAAEEDDWEAALRAFEEVRVLDPADARAVNGSGLAKRMVQTQEAVDSFLSRPERLGSTRVADAARAALSEARTLTALSVRLAAGAEALEHAIEAWQTPVPVRILSDDQTEIGIRGVGTVGRTRERTIELLPGRYVFEGRREGYRSELVETVVQAGPDGPVEVRIVCHERS